MATQIDIDRSQDLQDKGIRKEFQNVYRQFEEQRSYMDGRFQQIDDRFQQVDDRFQQVDDRFQVLEAMAMNSRATSSWHDITPIGVLNPRAEPRSRYQMPPSFPNKVIKFWHLQRPRNQHKLVGLLRFYNIRGLERLETEIFEDSDDGDSESSSESLPTLEQAVEANPALALSRLAARLGLDYDSISHNMGIVGHIQAITAQHMARGAKREQSSEGDKKDRDVARPTKRAATREPSKLEQKPSHDVLPPQPEVVFIAGVPVKMLVDEIPAPESPSTEGHVSWANASPLSGPKIRDISETASLHRAAGNRDSITRRPKEAADSPASRTSTSPPEKIITKSSQPSKGSTIPFTHTPSVLPRRMGVKDSKTDSSPKSAV